MKNIKLIEKLIKINKVCKVTKGRRVFSYTTILVKGDKNGFISYGIGKAKEILDSIQKASFNCKKNFIKVHIIKGTIPYFIQGKFKKSIIKMYPAKKHVGVISNKYIKYLFECLGIKNIYSKLIGSKNCYNIIKCTFNALKKIKSLKQISKERNISINKIINI
ncbi:MAG: 30S ribosomal protein S5 [Candidatus Shikimatogenerans sp. Ttur]|uniref:Small ribosomal subunit protein uS5 n=1 Tax=Candidatus Shikimatogenerans sp. Ttur TaxID=3158569 RepID=A0AAU7ZXX4_9FLAO